MVAKDPPLKLEATLRAADGMAGDTTAALLVLPGSLPFLANGALKDKGLFIGNEKAVVERTRNA